MNRWSRNVVALTSVGFLCATQGCELAVQLDRSLVTVGDDAGCPICSGSMQVASGDDAAAGDAATDEETDAGSADAPNPDGANADAPNPDGANADAETDASTVDSSVDAGG